MLVNGDSQRPKNKATLTTEATMLKKRAGGKKTQDNTHGGRDLTINTHKFSAVRQARRLAPPEKTIPYQFKRELDHTNAGQNEQERKARNGEITGLRRFPGRGTAKKNRRTHRRRGRTNATKIENNNEWRR